MGYQRFKGWKKESDSFASLQNDIFKGNSKGIAQERLHYDDPHTTSDKMPCTKIFSENFLWWEYSKHDAYNIWCPNCINIDVVTSSKDYAKPI